MNVEQSGHKLPPPTGDKLERAKSDLRIVFRDEFLRDDAVSRKALADHLISLATHKSELRGSGRLQVAEVFAALTEALEIGRSLGDHQRAFAALDALASTFELENFAAVELDTFSVVLSNAAPDAIRPLLDAAFSRVVRHIAVKDWLSALRLYDQFTSAAKTHQVMLGIDELEFDSVSIIISMARECLASRELLVMQPSNSEALQTSGLFALFVEGDAVVGISALLRSSDPGLMRLAELEQKARDADRHESIERLMRLAEREQRAREHSGEAADMRNCAEGWKAWVVSGAVSKARLERVVISQLALARASEWYVRALDVTSGLERERIRVEINDIEALKARNAIDGPMLKADRSDLAFMRSKPDVSRLHPDIRPSIESAIAWICRHQNRDGSWAAESLNELCTQGSPCWPPTLDGNGKEIPRTNHYDEGLTALSTLALLRFERSPGGERFADDKVAGGTYSLAATTERALKWLCSRQNEDGSFTKERFMYNECLAAMALTEAYGLTQARAWKEPAQKAIDFLVAAQKKNPNGSGLWGWRYHARSIIEERKERGEIDDSEYAQLIYDADTSVTTWAVMALKSAQLSGLKVPKEAMDGANAFIRYVTPRGEGDSSAPAGNQTGALRDTGSYNGLVGYLDAARAGEKVGGPRDMFTYYPEAMSALGMCSRIFINHDHSDPFLRAAADRIAKKPPTAKEKLNIDYYYWYYGTLALNQYDGPDSPNKGRGGYWDRWNKAMNDAILELQDKTETKDICNHGGWLTLDRWSYSGGPIYTTALNLLTLHTLACTRSDSAADGK